MVRDQPTKEVSNHMGKTDPRSATRANKSICLPISQEDYLASIENSHDFRKHIDHAIGLFPELFPAAIESGYRMKDIYLSKKTGNSDAKNRNRQRGLQDKAFLRHAVHDRFYRR